MNRVSNVVALRVVAAAIILCFGVSRLQGQTPTTPPPAHESTKAPDDKDAKETKDAKDAKEDEEDKDDPFAPEPAPALPPGMSGSDANDPRAKLAPGLYDAGETSMGIKHLLLLKKPDAFQLGVTDPDDPKVQKVIGQLGMSRAAKLPKPTQLVVAQLAFANSDFAFQGNHLFQGNFYGVNIYDISNPANASLLTSLCALAGKAMCRYIKICCSCQWKCPMDAWIAAHKGFHRDRRRPLKRKRKRNVAFRPHKKTVSAA
ncbi:MAG TPA: hypothetical protein VH140_14090 [Candidatus Acidoferrum sp.]|nr:hypothetical protein [Candidatus Acidoferrum sp.]